MHASDTVAGENPYFRGTWDILFSNNAGEENSNSELVLTITTIELMLSQKKN